MSSVTPNPNSHRTYIDETKTSVSEALGDIKEKFSQQEIVFKKDEKGIYAKKDPDNFFKKMTTGYANKSAQTLLNKIGNVDPNKDILVKDRGVNWKVPMTPENIIIKYRTAQSSQVKQENLNIVKTDNIEKIYGKHSDWHNSNCLNFALDNRLPENGKNNVKNEIKLDHKSVLEGKDTQNFKLGGKETFKIDPEKFYDEVCKLASDKFECVIPKNNQICPEPPEGGYVIAVYCSSKESSNPIGSGMFHCLRQDPESKTWFETTPAFPNIVKHGDSIKTNSSMETLLEPSPVMYLGVKPKE